jgi:general secretion pathway protein K
MAVRPERERRPDAGRGAGDGWPRAHRYQLSGTDVEARPSQGAFRFRLGRGAVAVEFRSEAARIDLNAAPKERLAGLFAGLGARQDAADYYADRIVAWRQAGEVAGENPEASAYRSAGLG